MLNWIVIGIGDITIRRVIPAIQAEPRSRLYGLVTRDPAKAAQFGAKAWTSLDEALADPAVQAVYVGTPVFLHAPQTIQALRAGKHVLCEKPMAMNEAEARTMVSAAEAEWQALRCRLLPPLLSQGPARQATAGSRRNRKAGVRRTDQPHVV